MEEYLIEYGNFRKEDAINYYIDRQAEEREKNLLPPWNELTETEQAIYIEQFTRQLKEGVEQQFDYMIDQYIWEQMNLDIITENSIITLLDMRKHDGQEA